jgi:hypothetical protein
LLIGYYIPDFIFGSIRSYNPLTAILSHPHRSLWYAPTAPTLGAALAFHSFRPSAVPRSSPM